ncbi:MAG TPA: acyl-CoA dehydrogenase family protein [Solirubrobacteraceae bacterium]|jgi:acyl-CoA dehydrogenase
MIEFSLTDEQRDLQELARSFAQAELPPVAAAVESDDERARALYAAMFGRAADAGLHALLLPAEAGGTGGSCVDNVLVQEEFGALDVALAGSLNLTMCVPLMLASGASADQRDRWLAEIVGARDHVIAGALNEPDVAGSELFSPLPSPSLGVRTRAERDGNGYVLRGAKAGFVTNAGVAKAFLVFARTDASKGPMEGTSVFYVPADTKGLTVGPPTRLLGMRASWHAEVVLDDVAVGEDRRVGPEGGGLAMMGQAAAPMALGLAAGFVGLARRALDEAVNYAKQRTSWGSPIFEHQAVALHLAEMDIELSNARLAVWHAAWLADRRDPLAARRVPGAKAYAVDAAISIAGRAVKVLGGYGVAEEYPTAKLLRDAWTGWSCDFTGDMLRLDVARQL